jgi:Phytanoyl-CoA dioxygenase (PhyH)
VAAANNGRVDVDAFIHDGYVAIRGAVDQETVVACRELIWAAMERRGVWQHDRATWPVLLEMDDVVAEPFAAAGTAPALVAAYDELIGPGRWSAPIHVGEALVVRFPAAEDERANAGYHIEGSYAGSRPGEYRVNVRSKARGLLALFLFTDVGPDDAPTRLMCGSHLYPPEFLAPYGEAGTNSDADFWRPSILCLPVAHATGRAGDVFLCHPFIVHTATWPHRGTGPRMLAQPAIHVRDGFALDGSDGSPVARAIVAGLELTGTVLPKTGLPSGAGSPGRRPPG